MVRTRSLTFYWLCFISKLYKLRGSVSLLSNVGSEKSSTPYQTRISSRVLYFLRQITFGTFTFVSIMLAGMRYITDLLALTTLFRYSCDCIASLVVIEYPVFIQTYSTMPATR